MDMGSNIPATKQTKWENTEYGGGVGCIYCSSDCIKSWFEHSLWCSPCTWVAQRKSSRSLRSICLEWRARAVEKSSRETMGSRPRKLSNPHLHSRNTAQHTQSPDRFSWAASSYTLCNMGKSFKFWKLLWKLLWKIISERLLKVQNIQLKQYI